MINYIADIAEVRKVDRFNGIINVLNNHNIPYVVEEYGDCYQTKNIIISINQNSAEKAIVIGAHYDNYEGKPAANDNAAACDILLNLCIELIKSKTNRRIDFVFFDNEEKRAIGSQLYLKKRDKKTIDFYINLDMCGQGNNIVIKKDLMSNNSVFQKLINNTTVNEVNYLPGGDDMAFSMVLIPNVVIIASTDNDLNWYINCEYNIRNHNLNADFFQTMHKSNDTLNLINYDIMDKIFNYILGSF